MRSASVFLSAFLLAAPCAIGLDHSKPAVATLTSGIDERCPVSLRAEQRAAGETLATAPKNVSGAKQALAITLENRDYRDIVSLELEVRGTVPRAAVIPAQRAGNGDSVRHIHLGRRLSVSESAHSDLVLEDLSSVRDIALVSVTFIDGVTWKASSPDACRIAPDGFMLVARTP